MTRVAVGRAPWMPLLATVVVASFVLAATTRSFGSSYNIFVILQAAAFDAVIGLSQMVVLAVGDLSLAVGGIGGLATVVIGNLFEVHHWPAGAALLAGIVLGTICGVVNGLIVSRTRLSGFIVTLATGAAFGGAAYGVTGSIPYSDIPSVVSAVDGGRAGVFPYLLLIALVATALVLLGFRWLQDGRSILAVGGNREAALLSGISRQRAEVVSHAASGFLAAIAAIMYMGILGSATPATGTDWLIISFAVPIIGGTALTGGEVSAVGGVVAAIALSAINDALIVLNVNTNAVTMAEGLMVLVVVLAGHFGGLRRRRDGRPSDQRSDAGAPSRAVGFSGGSGLAGER